MCGGRGLAWVGVAVRSIDILFGGVRSVINRFFFLFVVFSIRMLSASAIVFGVLLVFGVGFIFNPYLANGWLWKGCQEEWTTRERSYGHPFYWKLRFFGGERMADGMCVIPHRDHLVHPILSNRPQHHRRYPRNVMYLE